MSTRSIDVLRMKSLERGNRFFHKRNTKSTIIRWADTGVPPLLLIHSPTDLYESPFPAMQLNAIQAPEGYRR
ncbi:MAG: hypothetical protein QM501_06325, partial [Gimesia sp.]